MDKIKEIDTNSWHLFLDESGDANYKRLRKLKQQNNWSEFKPDPDPHNITLFSLVGLLVNGKDLVESFIPAMKKFKRELYGDENTVIHFSDMLAGTRDFTMYKNKPELFKKHLQVIINAISNVNFVFNLVHIDKVRMLNKYKENAASPYELAPAIIMERSAGYICDSREGLLNLLKKDTDKVIRVWFESRGKAKDTELKGFMVKELGIVFPETEKTIQQNHFLRYKSSSNNISTIEWHIHPLPKDPSKLKQIRYYVDNYSYEAGKDLINGIHLSDIIVSASRRFTENIIYNKYKYLEVEQVLEFINHSGKLKYPKLFP